MERIIAWNLADIFGSKLQKVKPSDSNTPWPSVFKYVGNVSNGFLYALETCLVNLELS